MTDTSVTNIEITDELQRFIETLTYALTESVEFYTAAGNASNALVNRKIFNRVAIARNAVLANLQTYLNDSPTHYAFGSALQKVYPDMFAGLIKNADPSLMVVVQKHEAKLQNILQEVLAATFDTAWHLKLVDLFPQANGDQVPFIIEKAS